MKNDKVGIFFFCGANKKLDCRALITVFCDYGSKNYGTDYLFLSGPIERLRNVETEPNQLDYFWNTIILSV